MQIRSLGSRISPSYLSACVPTGPANSPKSIPRWGLCWCHILVFILAQFMLTESNAMSCHGRVIANGKQDQYSIITQDGDRKPITVMAPFCDGLVVGVGEPRRNLKPSTFCFDNKCLELIQLLSLECCLQTFDYL